MSAVQRHYYLRSPLARCLYDRMIKEEQLKSIDRSLWYRCDLDQLTAELRDVYIAFDCDKDTDAFLKTCYEKSDWFFVQLYHSLAKAFLCWFMTQTSINGFCRWLDAFVEDDKDIFSHVTSRCPSALRQTRQAWQLDASFFQSFLGRGSTFVFSQAQFLRLLDVGTDWHSDALLDLGAGDGNVTAVMAPYFDTVHVTEVSTVMQRILTKKGFWVLDPERWTESTIQYDVIGCLNLLDRCDKPLTMLNIIKSKLKPITGRLLVALVLPLSQYLETGKSSHQPSEKLLVEGRTIEEQLVNTYYSIFEPSGYEIIHWTRLPYLCEGDIEQTFYWLTDIVFVLKVKSPSEKSEE